MNKSVLATILGVSALGLLGKKGQFNSKQKLKDWNEIFKSFETFVNYIKKNYPKAIGGFGDLLFYPGYAGSDPQDEDIEFLLKDEEEFIQYLHYWYGLFRGFFELKEITIYRVLDVESAEDISENYLGQSWTWSLETAKAFCFGLGEINDEGFNEKCAIVEAILPTEDIDWRTTIDQMLKFCPFSSSISSNDTYYSGRENEIFTESNNLFVKKIYVLSNHHDSGYSRWNHPTFQQLEKYNDYEIVEINKKGTANIK